MDLPYSCPQCEKSYSSGLCRTDFWPTFYCDSMFTNFSTSFSLINFLRLSVALNSFLIGQLARTAVVLKPAKWHQVPSVKSFRRLQ